MPSPDEVTRLLAEARGGSQSAVNLLFALLNGELHRLARHYMRRERAGHTLQATALVNEAYLRLINQDKVNWQDRAHFFGMAARVMRHVLVDYARGREAEKRGGGETVVVLDAAIYFAAEQNIDLLALDEALQRLAALDPVQSQMVEMRYFGGLTIEEIAEVLNVSAATVSLKWKTARLWLREQLSPATPAP